VTFQEKWVQADGFNIRYLEAGSGPPLVHIHSAGGLRISRAHELLAASHRVIAFEVPGYGPEANERSQTLADLGTSLIKAAHEIGLETFNLWGTSFGGAVATWAAFGAPESLETLILEGPGAIPPDTWPEIRRPEDLHRNLYAHPDRFAQAPAVEPRLLAQRRALLERTQREITRADVEQRLSQLNVPTLVIFGTHDRLIPPELGRVYAEKMPKCQFVLVYDAGHETAAERPEAFADLVSEFVQRRDAFVVTQRSSVLHP
jgi:pimeloyl-ACP methyl ester carboxylesterase